MEYLGKKSKLKKNFEGYKKMWEGYKECKDLIFHLKWQ